MIKYGIIGCGGHALQSHALSARGSESLELAALFDIQESSMQKLLGAYGSDVPCFASEEGLLASGVQAVVIATPDEFHTDNLRRAIAAGVHVLVEKPLAINQKQLIRLPELFTEAKKKNLVISSCHPRRFDPPFVWAKKSLPGLIQEFGPVVGMSFDFSYHEPTAAWKNNRSLLLDHLNHEIDLLNFLFGYLEFSAQKIVDGFDRYEVVGSRSDGISFHFRGTRRLRSRKFLEWMNIRFDRGDVFLNTESDIAWMLNHETGERTEEVCGATDYATRFKGVMENFAAAILGKEACYLTHQDLWINTAAGVVLNETGMFDFR